MTSLRNKSLLVIAIIVILTFILSLSIKPLLIKTVKDNYKLQLNYDSLDIPIFNPSKIKINNLSISLDNKDLIKFKVLKIDFEIMELMNNHVKVNSIMLNDSDIKLNNKSISHLKKSFIKKESKISVDSTEEKFNITIDNLQINNLNLSFNEYTINKLNLQSRLLNNIFTFDNLSFNIFGGVFSNKGYFDIINLNAESKGSYSNINLKHINPFLKDKKIELKGLANLFFNLSYKNKKPQGDILFKSKNINIKGLDLDQLLEGFLDSREAGLLDIASYMTLGPFGALLTNTLESTKSLPGMGGSSHIKELNAKLSISDNSIQMKDVAISSKENRISVSGSIDYKKQNFRKLNIHILNKEGCSRYTQNIRGTFANPEFGVTKTVLSGLIAPVTDLLSKAKDLAVDCEKVYKGEVKHP